MAIYVLPDFNLNVAFWRNANWPANPPDVLTIGNLSPGKIVAGDMVEDAALVPGPFAAPIMWLRVPKGTDCQDVRNNGLADVCECPYTSGRFYWVTGVDDIGGGFPNEHRFALLVPMRNWPLPFPPVGGFTPIIPPTPPPFLINFTTGGTLQTSQTYGPFTSSARIGGYIVVYNSAIPPTFNTGVGAGTVVFGAPFTCNFGFGLGQTAYLYSWTYIPVAGVNNLTVSTSQIGGAAWSGCVWDTFYAHGITTAEGNATGAGTPTEPPYAPPSPHPWIHHSFVVQVTGASPVYALPFVNDSGGFVDVIAGTTLKSSTGIYLAGVSGVFPAHCNPGAFGAWGMLQVGWAP